ncbi:EAL domain-containing protein [Massilia sp. CCM 8695]|uniref:EAL domain-containing protein n=1 Tax=Massilia frigida TaxID=2609281 RepID=A0ABX0NKH1_9BURK|nr:EAL domain-containing protein [Massilia frigida]NHZ84114.1 EAL domain-containing protein [Massilia frigida]
MLMLVFAPIHDAGGKVAGAVIVFRDVSTARHMSSQMTHLAQHDCLTDLPNRALLSDRITQAIEMAGRHQTLLAVLFLDLDRFKHVNDSLGHVVGDHLLLSVARRLTMCVRAADTVSRSGGDEFVILLSEVTHASDVGRTAEKIIAALTSPHSINGHELRITVSVGISIYPRDGADGETLIKNADLAMYRAKDYGRNNFQLYGPDMSTRSVERLDLESGLRGAIERQEFTLHYQSRVDIANGAVIGCEALIRWQHPERDLIPPLKFIGIAEECGLIVQIGHWVLSEVCRQIRSWEDAGLQPVPVSLNISALEFRNRRFLDSVRTVLSHTGVDPHYLEFELTESVLMENAESSSLLLKELKKLGIQVAIDDFGTGYSSLSYLSYFSVDVLKIDQSFVRDMEANPDNATIISAIIGMCEGLKCRVIAEGVETQEQRGLLLARRCREAQGYLFSRPIVAAEFARFLYPIAPDEKSAFAKCAGA